MRGAFQNYSTVIIYIIYTAIAAFVVKHNVYKVKYYCTSICNGNFVYMSNNISVYFLNPPDSLLRIPSKSYFICHTLKHKNTTEMTTWNVRTLAFLAIRVQLVPDPALTLEAAQRVHTLVVTPVLLRRALVILYNGIISYIKSLAPPTMNDYVFGFMF